MPKSKQQKTLYKRDESPYWYYDYKDPVTGRRTRKSTHEKEYPKALQVYRDSLGASTRIYASPTSTLRHLLELYTSPETNPRMRQKQLDGYRYSLEHAQHVALHARNIIKIIEQSDEYLLLRKKIGQITKLDVRTIRDDIVLAQGRCRSSQQCFTIFKTFLSQAELDGIIPFSPGEKVPNIKYDSKRRTAIEAAMIGKAIARPEIFPNTEEWAFFTVLATTGMRKSEVLAISTRQLFQGRLTIDSALKSNNPDDLGLPKCDIIRVIPLAHLALEALSKQGADEEGRFFHHGRCWGDSAFKRCKAAIIGAYPEDREIWDLMTPHVLRHSVNSNLLCEGANPSLVAEYLGWQHQELLDIQRRYTHPLIYKLSEIAAQIDELYGKREAPAVAVAGADKNRDL